MRIYTEVKKENLLNVLESIEKSGIMWVNDDNTKENPLAFIPPCKNVVYLSADNIDYSFDHSKENSFTLQYFTIDDFMDESFYRDHLKYYNFLDNTNFIKEVNRYE